MGKKTTTTVTVLVAERVTAPFVGCRVDREVGVIRGALICGPTSQNGRDYSRESFGDGRQYAGRHVYLNHHHGGPERRAEDKVGWFGDDIRFRANGMPEGDFHVLKSHPMAEAILEAAERNPSLFGFSHMARLRERRERGGRSKVEAVVEVQSVDLVATPATTNGIYESVNRGGIGVKTTLREVIESVRAKLPAERQPAARKLLLVAEDDAGMGGLMDAPIDAPPDDAGPDDSIDAGIRGLVNAILDDDSLSTDDKLKKIRLTLTMGDKLNGSAPADDKPADDKPAEESRKLPSLKDVVAECEAAKLPDAPPRLLERLTTIADPDTRKFVLEQAVAGARSRTGETVRVAGRHEANGAGGGKTESKPARVTL